MRGNFSGRNQDWNSLSIENHVYSIPLETTYTFELKPMYPNSFSKVAEPAGPFFFSFSFFFPQKNKAVTAFYIFFCGAYHTTLSIK